MLFYPVPLKDETLLGEKYHDIVHRNLAMDSVKESMESLALPSEPFGNPVAYTFMYVQWEANRVLESFYPFIHYGTMNHHRFILSSQIIGKQLIRNMGLAFAVIALVSLLLIADPIVRWAD